MPGPDTPYNCPPGPKPTLPGYKRHPTRHAAAPRTSRPQPHDPPIAATLNPHLTAVAPPSAWRELDKPSLSDTHTTPRTTRDAAAAPAGLITTRGPPHHPPADRPPLMPSVGRLKQNIRHDEGTRIRHASRGRRPSPGVPMPPQDGCSVVLTVSPRAQSSTSQFQPSTRSRARSISTRQTAMLRAAAICTRPSRRARTRSSTRTSVTGSTRSTPSC